VYATDKRFVSATGLTLSREMGLSGFWDDVYGVVEKVASITQAAPSVVRVAQSVATGQSRVAVVPSKGTSIVQPVGSGPFAIGVGLPTWLIPVGLGLAAILILRARPR